MKTLEERFENINMLVYPNRGDNNTKMETNQVEICVYIAEDFATDFAEWCTKYRELNRNSYGDILYAKSKYDDDFLIEELLEMYKEEKSKEL